MLKLNFKICEAISLEYQHSAHSAPYPVTVFEHGILGQTVKHAHLHFLPAVLDFTSKIKRDFPTAEMEELKCAAHIQYLYYERKEPYLFWSAGFPQGSESMVCWNPPASSQYLRVVAAEFLGRPERADWRNMDPELDKKLWMETVIRLKKYFL